MKGCKLLVSVLPGVLLYLIPGGNVGNDFIFK